MRTHVLVSIGAPLTAALMVAFAPVRVQSQATPAMPRTADGKPDFSGIWDTPKAPGSRGGGATVFDKAKMAPFKPGGEALFYEPRTGDPRHDEPRAFCMPSGFPSAFLGPYPIQIVQTPAEHHTPLAPFVLLGGAALAGGAGGFFGLQSQTNIAAAKDAPFESDADKQLGLARSNATAANVLFGVAGAAAIAAVISFVATAGD